MALHDYKCDAGHITTTTIRPETCSCGLPVEITYEFWDTVRTPSTRIDRKYAHKGEYDPVLKTRITSREQRRRLMKEGGFADRSDFTPETFFRETQEKEDPKKAERRHERASRFASHKPSRERYAEAIKDLRKGKI